MKAIIVRYIGPTNVKGSRIIAGDDDGNKVTIPYYHHVSRDEAYQLAAKALCEKMGWHGTLVQGSLKNAEVFVWLDEYTPRIELSGKRFEKVAA